jgi:hypothetical protein
MKIKEMRKMLKRYQYNCVITTDREELDYILEHSKDITYKTFKKNVEKEFIKEFEDNVGISLAHEYAASFYKSKTLKGKIVYYFTHSSIEYIFY